ncbi:hypothetical protein MGR01S_00920 [Meiothermus granaticius NBRC 107808]|uniref:Uncharacterized protein n=1 Tax=Meiothermus granaticius NBRC 107808 TaxID=1227551 RepID=A0A399F736_9DEIN|nr:hypothetical protein Mgrana_02188 [Meiothermus granaticius NBRC 107808]GEM85467.1 hypothetical protein MGR01S_00920 [Meiothermus granaticius NBRC 107808]
MGQSLSVPSQSRVGEDLKVQGSGFPAGNHTLTISGADSGQLEVNAEGGSFVAHFTPTKAGSYRFSVALPQGRVEAQTQVQAAAQGAPPTGPAQSPQSPALPTPQLTPEGLSVGDWKLPLSGTWMGPRVVGTQAYLAQGPLVLEVDLSRPALVAEYYPPAEVRSLEADPEPTVLLEDGRRLPLTALSGRPYEGRWESLKVIQNFFDTLAAAGKTDLLPVQQRPYWYYFTRSPATLSAADLEAVGQDLLRRGHRPELAWGNGVMLWLGPWLNQVSRAHSQGLDPSLTWSEFFLKYMPQVPGARAVFWEQIGWLEAQGRPDLAERYREGLRKLSGWQNPIGSSQIGALAWVLLGLYVLMLIYLTPIYLPAQLEGVRPAGGWLLGWFRHPLLRLRYSTLAYTSFGERLLLLVLFLLTVLAFLAWSFALRSEGLAAQDSLTRGTLRSLAAQQTLRGLPNTGPVQGLLAYALAKDSPEESKRLYAAAPPWTYVLLGRGTPSAIAAAFRQAPDSGAAREAIGVGGDLWSAVYRGAGVPREGVPTPRIIAVSIAWSNLQSLKTDFPATWRELPLWSNPTLAWVVAALVLILALYHVLCFFLPRPSGAIRKLAWQRGVQLFVPGSPWFGQGWGVILLLAFAAGIWLWRSGNPGGVWLAAAVLLLHLILWFTLLGQTAQRGRRGPQEAGPA